MRWHRRRNWFIEDLYFPTWNRLDGLLAGVSLAVLKEPGPGMAEMGAYSNRGSVGGIVIVAFSACLSGIASVYCQLSWLADPFAGPCSPRVCGRAANECLAAVRFPVQPG